MLRLCCLNHPTASQAPAEREAPRKGRPAGPPEAAPSNAEAAEAVDTYAAPANAPKRTARTRPAAAGDDAPAALRALDNIATTDLAVASDYQRACLVQDALDACVPWFAACNGNPGALDALRAHLNPASATPETAGLLAGVCIAACSASLQRTGRLGGGGAGNGAVVDAVFANLQSAACMQFVRPLLETCGASARASAGRGREAVHDATFETFMGALTATLPPPLRDIAFLQHALTAMSAVDVGAAYRVRKVHALPAALPPDATAPESKTGRDYVQNAHAKLHHFVKFEGGMDCGGHLRWAVLHALDQSVKDPFVLQHMFEPIRWGFASVHNATDRAPKARCDLHAHLTGAMYLSVLFYMAGWRGRGLLKRGGRPPVDVKAHRDFIAHIFVALHRGILRLPEGHIPAQQLAELHQVALDAVAKDCDAYTLRARLQAYAAAAAASPGLTELGQDEAAKVAEAWEAVKSRLFTDEWPLDPAT